MRTFSRFSYRNADYRIYSTDFKLVTEAIVNQREILENFILTNKIFLNSLEPVPPLRDIAPHITKMMQKAGKLANVGPMAAVAGSIAQLAVEKSSDIGDETIVENGGDIFMVLNKELILGIHSGVDTLEGKLAFRIKPKNTPLAVCSSSSTMGHSVSLGDCNLATVFSKSGALADAAATRACNMIKSKGDIQSTLDEISAIPGITGLMIIKGDSIGMVGDIPELISNADPDMMNKITRHK